MDDIGYIANNLREADKLEIITYRDTHDFAALLTLSVEGSAECQVVRDGNPVLLFGLSQVTPKSAVIWALGTDQISNKPITFMRQSRLYVGGWFKKYTDLDYVFNFVHPQNHLHKKWLQWLGADFLPPLPYGVNNQLAIPFIIHRKNVKYV